MMYSTWPAMSREQRSVRAAAGPGVGVAYQDPEPVGVLVDVAQQADGAASELAGCCSPSAARRWS